MTPAEYLQKHPKARASSLAHRIARDEKTEQLRRELAQSKSRPWWAFWRKR